jgi:Zn finger protein HypA/HybF involved in hydrogenase expression
MAKIPSYRYMCERCDHIWTPRIEVSRICPKCKSAYWDVPRQSKKGERT